MYRVLNPYLNFPGTAREAMEFYQSVLGGDLDLLTFGQAGVSDAPNQDGVMHAHLSSGAGFTLMASDMPAGMEHKPGNTMAVCLGGDDAEALRGFFAGLSQGGSVSVPLSAQVWGDEFGMFTDRFGTPWFVNISAPTAG